MLNVYLFFVYISVKWVLLFVWMCFNLHTEECTVYLILFLLFHT